MMTSLWRGLCSRLHRPPGCPKPHQCVNEASGMRGAAAGVVLMGKIASICHQRRPFPSMAASRTPRAAHRSLEHLVLLRGTTTIHNRCLVREGGEWCLFCGLNEGEHWGEHLHFILRDYDGNVLANNSPLHSILSTQIVLLDSTFNRDNTKREALKKRKQLIDCLSILFISCESPSLLSIGICVIFHVFTTDNSLQTSLINKPFLAANEGTIGCI